MATQDDANAPPPLSPKVFMILLAFAEGTSHGYQIKKAVEERSDGQVRLDAGSLYRALARLLDDGLIEETQERPEPSCDDTRRRYYRLTDMGRRAVAAEARRLAGLLEIARAHDLVDHPEAAR
jgi:DNA-binding PadR family transcriptional regulator